MSSTNLWHVGLLYYYTATAKQSHDKPQTERGLCYQLFASKNSHVDSKILLHKLILETISGTISDLLLVRFHHFCHQTLLSIGIPSLRVIFFYLLKLENTQPSDKHVGPVTVTLKQDSSEFGLSTTRARSVFHIRQNKNICKS